MPKSPAQLLIERETQVTYGPIDAGIFGFRIEPGQSHIDADRYVLRTTSGIAYFYCKGEGITISRGDETDTSEEQLWLNGSVYSAVACINGFMPIHASAVAHDGRVFAFTGPSGSGKSSLIAALGWLGLPMFCDDTLVLDLSNPDRIICLPGHKRLKLTPAAIELTGAEREERVAQDLDKYYARALGGDASTPLPLARLLFLEQGSPPSIEPLSGSERFTRTHDEHYTAELFAAARRFDRTAQFEHRAKLARQIPMARFIRPWDARQFHESVAHAAQYVTDGGRD
jgi:hypothetical protein